MEKCLDKGKGIWDLMGLSSHVNSAVYLYKLFHCLSLNFFNIKREKIIAIFQSCCAILHCHQQCIKVLDAPYFCQYSMLSALLILTIPLGVLIYLIVALILYFPND